jgi:hypothetical protein
MEDGEGQAGRITLPEWYQRVIVEVDGLTPID